MGEEDEGQGQTRSWEHNPRGGRDLGKHYDKMKRNSDISWCISCTIYCWEYTQLTQQELVKIDAEEKDLDFFLKSSKRSEYVMND